MSAHKSVLSWTLAAAVCLLSALAGCYVGYSAYTEHYTAADTALGEEHLIDFTADDALQFTQRALHGDGLLFEMQPDNSIVTLWRNADINTPTGWFPTMMGVQPRYRYEIRIVPLSGKSSKIIVNVRTEGIPDEELASYKASSRFALFKEIDELAATFPPPSRQPSTGGVNFALLPGESLQALAKRVTGSEDNWRQIAQDNGFTAPSEVTPLANIWVRNSLLKQAPESSR